MSNEKSSQRENLVAKSGVFTGMNTFMAIASMVMILGFVVFTIKDVEYSSAVFAQGKDFIIQSLDWFYVLVVNVVLFFVFWLLMSRFGDVKLGKDDEEPDFSTFSWICMLFSAGLGSGLIYWGVAEPMYHIQDSPFLVRAGIEANTVAAGSSAILVTNFHWTKKLVLSFLRQHQISVCPPSSCQSLCPVSSSSSTPHNQQMDS